MAERIRTTRGSVVVALFVAVGAFPPLCVMTFAVVRALLLAICDGLFALGIPTNYPFDVVVIGLMIGLPLLLSYMVSRWLYAGLRWKVVDATTLRCCEHCGYDLTGNVSGQCPECGSPISHAQEQQTP